MERIRSTIKPEIVVILPVIKFVVISYGLRNETALAASLDFQVRDPGRRFLEFSRAAENTVSALKERFVRRVGSVLFHLIKEKSALYVPPGVAEESGGLTPCRSRSLDAMFGASSVFIRFLELCLPDDWCSGGEGVSFGCASRA